MTYTTLLVDEQSPVVTITLNRPEQRNALSLQLMQELLSVLTEIATHKNCAVVVLRAQGTAFSAGHDLAEMRDQDLAFYKKLFKVCCDLMNKIQEIPQPVIAAVQGIATAAGCQLVASCDLAIASDTARFALPGVKVGIFCSTPAVAVSRNIPRKKAMEMLLLGDLISATEAERIDLINKVVTAEKLESAVNEWVEKILSSSAMVIGLGKQAFYRQLNLPQDQAYDYACEIMALNAMSDDTREGFAAFLAKRKPQWQNR